MSASVAFQSQLTSIMEILVNSAVADICRLVDDGAAVLHFEISQGRTENEALKMKLQLLERELKTAQRGKEWSTRKRSVAVGVQCADECGSESMVIKSEKHEESDHHAAVDIITVNGTLESQAFTVAGQPVRFDWQRCVEEWPMPDQEVDTGGQDHTQPTAILAVPTPNPQGHAERQPRPSHSPVQRSHHEPERTVSEVRVPSGRGHGSSTGTARRERCRSRPPSEPEVRAAGRQGDDLAENDPLRLLAPPGRRPAVKEEAETAPAAGYDEGRAGYALGGAGGEEGGAEAGTRSAPRTLGSGEGASGARGGARYPLADFPGFPQHGALPAATAATAADKPHGCSQCGRHFSHMHVLKRHQVVHSGLRPHACGQCGKRFSLRDSLRRHQRIHTGERPHGCPLCPKRFIQRTHLKIHLTVHTRERPFTCAHCGRGFTQPHVLRRHMATHAQGGATLPTHAL